MDQAIDHRSPSEQLASCPIEEQEAFLKSISDDEAQALLFDWRNFHARPDQIAPDGEWDIWLLLAGRGFGKTRSGAEWIKEQVENGARRIALVAETQKDLEEVMVAGESGILSLYPENMQPKYTKKPVKIVWPNGAIALGYNATEPDQLRGPQFDCAWSDELAKWRHARATWDQLQFGLRLGDHPQQIVTTTPRPIEVLKEIVAGKEGIIVTTKGKTKDNLANLAPAFIRKIYNRFEGTRLGRQELNAEILGDIPNALWTYQTLETSRVLEAPPLGRVVISIDPAVSNTENSDAHGIFAIGLDEEGNDAYVLEDGSLHGSPLDWATRVLRMYDEHQADAIVAEINQGGDMVEHTIKTKRSNANVIKVRATKGKHVRAEPVASLYEQGRVHHVGAFDQLEKEMTMMTTAGYKGDNSPDRLDSVVWGITELLPDLILEKTEPIKMNFTGWNG